ncbi:MAG TPA: beta-galactosidase [Ktedonobacteraceae bacterium]|nr:beta-galactosidase [Ktedonobacteraceae bacterium]
MTDVIFGVDYYPEHWSPERWPIDARLMQQAGINTVRLAEFAWSRLEPREGTFDFSWLDEAIEIFMAHGIRIVLGTPTAAPPAWLIQAHPEILPVNEAGQRAGFGMRRHYCPTQPTFHAATQRIVEAMAEHYHQHPAVFAWQIDNELGNISNGNRCHCPSCHAAFQQWLQRRYGSLTRLNQDWGTVFWSQEYTAWEQIPIPLQNVRSWVPGSAHNPSLYLDFARFTSESWERYQHFQMQILRAHCPQHLITHNLMGLFPYVDYVALAEELDVVSWDNYPRMPTSRNASQGNWSPSRVAMAHDLMRSLKGRTFWVMEQQGGPSGWGSLSPTPLPGELRLWTLQAIAHGAEAIVYFRWRTSRMGTEQYWHGILPHDGTPRRRYAEIRQTGEELQRLGALVTTSLSAEVAILRSYDVLWAFEAQPTSESLSYDDQIGRYYRALWRRNVTVDLVTEKRPWTSYKVLVAPCLFVLSDEVAAQLRSWVEAGGTLVLTFRSGVKNEQNVVVDLPLPGALCELAGVHVTDYTVLLSPEAGPPSGGPASLELSIDGTSHLLSTDVWMDELEVSDAEVLGRYCGGPFAGTPAITMKRVGAGRVIYVGTSLDDAGQDLLIGKVLSEAGVTPGIPSPDNVEIVHRVYENVDHWFILNYGTQSQEVRLPTGGIELLTGKVTSETVTVNALDALVVRSQPDA